jgi:ABC-type uncharacterized transport system ATPase subunit
MQQTNSSTYVAVRHVLNAPTVARRTARHIGLDDFDFVGLEQEVETMSGGESLLVQVARDLWTAERTVGVADLVARLDAGNFTRVVEALGIARGAFSWDLVEEIALGRDDENLAA